MTQAPIFVGNWKMYKTIEQSLQFLQSVTPLVDESQAQVYLAAPFTAIHALAQAAKGSQVHIGAQNMNEATEGAFTGEIAGSMLKEAGASFVILGHSERRHLFGETDAGVNKKVLRALQESLLCIVCIGETLEQRESGATERVLQTQLLSSLQDVSNEQFSHIMLAYEPVWAIGTGKSATAEEAQQIHRYCRTLLSQTWDEAVAKQTPLLYGGSVKPSNARSLIEQPDIDGLLIGGASLDVASFHQILSC